MEEVIKEELTMSAVPKAVNYLIEEVAEMRAILTILNNDWDWEPISIGLS
jgi:hypothetical protein